MKYRPSPDFIAAMVLIIAVVSLTAYIMFAIHLFMFAKQQDVTQRVNALMADQRPDISHCFKPEETRELWDCIRYKEKEDETND